MNIFVTISYNQSIKLDINSKNVRFKNFTHLLNKTLIYI